jgi:hypothetical protein
MKGQKCPSFKTQNTTRKGMERDLGLLHMLQKTCIHTKKKKRSIKIVLFGL